ncbi:MAG: phosphotransferase [Bacteroidales bacterium]|nr:phosphotransferase [Candidatus Colicola caccequi]
MQQITNGGSNRKYFRADGYIHVEGTNRDENHAFITMAKHFKSQGLNVPEVYRVSQDEMQYDIEDLGNDILFDLIANGRTTGTFNHEEIDLLRATMRALAHFQIKGDQGMDYSVCFPQPEFNRRSVMWDLNYWKYSFLKATGVEFQEDRLEDDFDAIADKLLQAPIRAFMYRDCQSRNVMIHNGQPYFIDFQGGRKGPVYYDVASFLWQAKANFSSELRDELIDVYLDELNHYIHVDSAAFRTMLKHFVLFRTLQVLGAYGFRGYFEKKTHFLESVPFAINNLKQLLNSPDDWMAQDYPYLSEVIRHLITHFESSKPAATTASKDRLTVRVFSFSYKKGLPTDISGNGGGFVFDCRAIHNPGRYDEYKQLTGKDQPVIDFIERNGDMKPFMEAAYQMVDASVKKYIERGFTDLMVSFGCTGGQHRSIYGAEQMAKHLKENFDIDVILTHREREE